MWQIKRRRATLARIMREITATLAAECFDTTLEEAPLEVTAVGRLTVIEQSPEIEGRRT
jgi:hypothetical protein